MMSYQHHGMVELKIKVEQLWTILAAFPLSFAKVTPF
jgi:hypothetical protein